MTFRHRFEDKNILNFESYFKHVSRVEARATPMKLFSKFHSVTGLEKQLPATAKNATHFNSLLVQWFAVPASEDGMLKQNFILFLLGKYISAGVHSLHCKSFLCPGRLDHRIPALKRVNCRSVPGPIFESKSWINKVLPSVDISVFIRHEFCRPVLWPRGCKDDKFRKDSFFYQ